MLIVFFDSHGLVHREFVRGETITAKVYLQVLKNLMVSIQHRCTAMWRRGDFVLHDDNASAHRAEPVMRWIGQHHIRTLEHPPYSPDLAPADFWMFPNLKRKLKGIRFPDLNTLEFETDRFLGEISSEEYKYAIRERWVRRWWHCIRKSGAYFEGMPE